MTDRAAPPEHAFGTAFPDTPVPRRDLERALRHQNLSDLDLREAVLHVGARVVALIDELTRRLDGVEPEPAPPGTAAAPPVGTLEQAVARNLAATLQQIRDAEYDQPGRVLLDRAVNKYDAPSNDVPCDELLHLCQARCCTFDFPLSTQDLDEGVIRWDYGHPYRIRQRADGYCVHNHPGSQTCTVHLARPRTCRVYDCRTDARVWIDFANRIPAPPVGPDAPPRTTTHGPTDGASFDIVARLRARAEATTRERLALAMSTADDEPTVGPMPSRDE